MACARNIICQDPLHVWGHRSIVSAGDYQGWYRDLIQAGGDIEARQGADGGAISRWVCLGDLSVEYLPQGFVLRVGKKMVSDGLSLAVDADDVRQYKPRLRNTTTS